MGKEKKRKKSKNSPKTDCGIFSAAKDSVSCFNVVTSIKWRVFRCLGSVLIETNGLQHPPLSALLYRIGLPSGCLRSGLSWFNWWVSCAPDFQCWYFCESSCLFYLRFDFDFYVSKILGAKNFSSRSKEFLI